MAVVILEPCFEIWFGASCASHTEFIIAIWRIVKIVLLVIILLISVVIATRHVSSSAICGGVPCDKPECEISGLSFVIPLHSSQLRQS